MALLRKTLLLFSGQDDDVGAQESDFIQTHTDIRVHVSFLSLQYTYRTAYYSNHLWVQSPLKFPLLYNIYLQSFIFPNWNAESINSNIFFSTPSLTTTIHFLSPLICTISTSCRYNGTGLPGYAWLISFSLMCSSFIHVEAYQNFLRCWNIPLCVHTTSCVAIHQLMNI